MSALLQSLADAYAPIADTALDESRRAALQAALADGLPGPRSERWRHTPLRALDRRAFAAPRASSVALDPAFIAHIPAPRLVLRNGQFDAAVSDLSGLPHGVRVTRLADALAVPGVRDAQVLARRFERGDEVFARLNAALARDGVLVEAEAGTQAGAPLHLVFVGEPDDADRAWHLRHRIELAREATLAVVEHHLAAGAHRHLANQLLHVHLAPGARLVHARVQDDSDGATQIARTDAALGSHARYLRIDLELGAGLSRHELNVALHGNDAHAHCNGVLLGTGARHVDTRLGIDHVGRDGACDLTWRGLAAGRSRATFHGGITIRAGADGTRAELSNKNLLLSDTAEIDTQPVLEIHADEVQAAHGATVGQLDPQALFYLRSRGLPLQAARGLLTAAFGRAALGAIEDPPLHALLDTALSKALVRLPE